jgi:hypothetical protein
VTLTAPLDKSKVDVYPASRETAHWCEIPDDMRMTNVAPGELGRLATTHSARFALAESELIRAAAKAATKREQRRVTPSMLIRRYVVERLAEELRSEVGR